MTDFAWTAVPTGLLAALVVAVVVQLALQLAALISLWRTPAERLHLGQKWPWALLIVAVNLVGALVYFAAARKPAEAKDAPPPPEPGGDRAARAAAVLYGAQGAAHAGGDHEPGPGGAAGGPDSDA